MPLVNVNGISVNYEIHGKGEPLVLIGGLGTDISVYRKMISHLSQKFMIMAFDNRGAGFSDKPDIPYTIEMMADDTAALMSAAGIERANILGTSLGGRIAMALALRHPGRVKKLILVSTFASQPDKKLPKSYHAIKLATGWVSVFRKKTQPYYAFMRQLEASRGFVCAARLGEISAPTLILHGTKDSIAPFKLAEEMHSGITDSKLVSFNGGHAFPLMHGESFIKEVETFLSGT
ncbi:MAG: alpha/beta hydrolase [Thermoplasmata archaeon]|nr:alpha/beta hydrolase [Thermoplasmata archaeon]